MSRRIVVFAALSVLLVAALNLASVRSGAADAPDSIGSTCVPLQSKGTHGLSASGTTTTAGTSGTATIQDYATFQGTTLSSITLPSGFNPAQASDAALAAFHLPARPTDPGALSNWMQNYGHAFYETVPTSPPCNSNQYAATSKVWGGRLETASGFTDVTGHWTQPNFEFYCLHASDRAIWDGIGGWGSGAYKLIQAGSDTIQGAGINDVRPWVEVYNLQPIQPVSSPTIRTGDSVNVETVYSTDSGGRGTWWFQNFTTGGSQGWTEPGVSAYYDGTHGEWVDERVSDLSLNPYLLRRSTNLTYWSGEYINGLQASSWPTTNVTMQDVNTLMTAVMGATITSSETWKDCGPGSGTNQ